VAAGYLLAGRRDKAAGLAATALTAARAQKQRGQEAVALWMSAEIAADAAEVEHAAVHYERALARASEIGMRPLVAHCHLGLGKLSRHTDSHARWKEHLGIAATMYREMRMSHFIDKVQAETG
jgi:hypothetical protein